MYKIKPLKWEEDKESANKKKWDDINALHEAFTPIAVFEIEQWASGDWAYSWCFCEYYDQGGDLCESLEDGKAKCEKIWVEKLEKCLIKEN
jgi:hypothetical protein